MQLASVAEQDGAPTHMQLKPSSRVLRPSRTDCSTPNPSTVDFHPPTDDPVDPVSPTMYNWVGDVQENSAIMQLFVQTYLQLPELRQRLRSSVYMAVYRILLFTKDPLPVHMLIQAESDWIRGVTDILLLTLAIVGGCGDEERTALRSFCHHTLFALYNAQMVTRN
uniref:Uncharacterized protein n=1 Tax=Lygus hesperus TaxID=30085 RepID=A0A146KPR8_LYGHE